MKGLTTRAIHGVQFKKDVHGSLRVPVYDTVAFEHPNAKDFQLAFEGKRAAHSYSRITNPTVEDFEQRLRLISEGIGVIAVSSGMAAISNVILALAESGSNIITSKNLFGNTVSLFEHTLGPWGLETKYVSMTNPEEIASAIDEKTRLIFFENITNPGLEVADVKAIAEVAKAHNIPLVGDCTTTTSYLFPSKEFGVNIEVVSSTKFISGGATSVGGIIIDNGNFNWKHSPKLANKAKRMGPMALLSTLRMEVYRNTGGCLSPHNAYLQSLGLETLALRIDRTCDNTMEVAEFMEKHEKVSSVHYPGLESSPYHETAKQQFGGKFGGILTFDLESKEACFSLMDALKLIKRTTNLNDNKTMVIHPSSTIFCEYPEEKKLEMGVRSTMIRLSVGIENIEDIINDLEQGLQTL